MPVIATNTAANTALRYLNLNASNESSALSKIASGSRITKASDDAAGLAIGTALGSDIVEISSAGMNMNNYSAILQTADGGLARISDVLQRMQALATESTSDTVTDAERSDYIQKEFSQLQKEVTSVADGTRYKDQSLLNNPFAFSATVGTNQKDTVSFTLADVSAAGLNIDKLDLSSKQSASDALTGLNSAVDQITNIRAYVGEKTSQFEFRSQSISFTADNTYAARSVVMDADVATEKTKLSSQDVKTQAAIAALSQANQMPKSLLDLLV